jgi:hypothetical protein
MSSSNGVLQSTVYQLHLHHIAARCFHRLLNSYWHFSCFPTSVTDPTFTVSHHREGGKTHNPTSFYGLGDAVYLYQFLLQVAFGALLTLMFLSFIAIS